MQSRNSTIALALGIIPFVIQWMSGELTIASLIEAIPFIAVIAILVVLTETSTNRKNIEALEMKFNTLEESFKIKEKLIKIEAEWNLFKDLKK